MKPSIFETNNSSKIGKKNVYTSRSMMEASTLKADIGAAADCNSPEHKLM